MTPLLVRLPHLMAVITSGLLSVPTSLSQNILAQAEFLSYENKVFGFSIQYPADWKKEEQSKHFRTF
jgi:hypothetical protein